MLDLSVVKATVDDIAWLLSAMQGDSAVYVSMATVSLVA